MKEKAPNPHRAYFKLDTELFTIDFLPVLPGLSKFKNSFDKREIVSIDGVVIPFLNFDDLIVNKNCTARQKDIADIEELKKKRNS